MIEKQMNRVFDVQRKFKRERVSLHADMVLENETMPSLVNNVSEGGLSILAFIEKDIQHLISDRTFRLDLRLPSGHITHLNCRKVWVERAIPPQIKTRRMGMEVIHPPQDYLYFTNNQPKTKSLPQGRLPVSL